MPALCFRPKARRRFSYLGWPRRLSGCLSGSYYEHYFLPVLVPLSVLVVPLAGAPGTGMNLFQINHRPITTPFIGVLAIMGLIAAKIQINEDIWHRGDGARSTALRRSSSPG